MAGRRRCNGEGVQIVIMVKQRQASTRKSTGENYTRHRFSWYEGMSFLVLMLVVAMLGSGARNALAQTSIAPPVAGNVSVSVPANSTNNGIPPNVSGIVTGISATAASSTGGSVSVTGLGMLYTPRGNFFGADTFTYFVSGPGGTSGVATVSVTVVPGPPVASDATLSVAYATAGTVDLASSVSGLQLAGLSVAIVQAPSGGTASVSGTRLTYTPGSGFSGADSLRYVAISASGQSQPAVLHISVRDRASPTESSGVRAIRDAGTATVRHFQTAQIENINSRLTELQGTSDGVGKPAGDQSRCAGRDGVWIGGIGSVGTLGGAGGFKFNATGVTAGGDRCISDTALVGLGIGYGHDRSRALGDGSVSGGSASSVSGYGSIRLLPQVRVAWMAGVGRVQVNYDRYLPERNDFAHGQWSGTQWLSSASVSYDWRYGGFRLAPYSRADVSTLQVDAYSESGGGPLALRYASQRISMGRASVGFNGEYTYESDWGKAIPRLRMEYQRDFARRDQAMVSYADSPLGQIYALPADAQERRAMIVSVGSDFHARTGLSLGLHFSYARSNGGYDTNTGQLRVSQKF